MLDTIVADQPHGAGNIPCGARAAIGRSTLCPVVSPTWIWMQIAIVVFVLIGMIIAITKLA
jgi:hypothetical protein